MASHSYISFGGLSLRAENPVLQPTPLLFKKYGILSFFYPDPPLPTYPDVYPEFSFYKIKKVMSKKRKGYCLQVLEASLDIEVTVNLQNLQNYFDFSKVAYFRPTRPTDLQTIYIFLLFNYKIFIYKGLGFWFCGFGCRFSVGFL
jgi:hypothetical protein